MSAWPPIADLLPHGPEARCIDEIVAFDPAGALAARLTVNDGLVMYDSGRRGIPAWGGIEIMAQAAGLHHGLTARAAGRGRPRVGYLIGVRNFHAAAGILAAGETLDVLAENLTPDSGDLAQFDCLILTDGVVRVRAVLTVMRTAADDNEEEW